MHVPLYLLFVVVAAPAWADECDQLPKPSVTVKLLEEAIALNTLYSIKSLNNIGAATLRPGHQVLGLTRGNAVAHFSSKIPSYRESSGRWECISPQITLSIGYRQMTVYVASEFGQGGCAYKEVHEHELRHVKAYQNHLKDIEKELGETLNRRFATGNSWRGPRGQLAAQIERELEERWMPYVRRELARVDAQQALIDTPEEYARVAAACGGEIQRVITGKPR